jgi:hypothetical protein
MDMEENYLTVGRGYDTMYGRKSPVGIWIWNMRIMKREFRFRDVFKQDLDLCNRVEAETGKSRTYSNKELTLGYHHPIWTPEELFMKFRYSMPKYTQDAAGLMKRFLEKGLEDNPENKALLAGTRGAEAAEKRGILDGSKDNSTMGGEYSEATRSLGLNGTEYYVKHKKFRTYAKIRLQSPQECHCVDELEPDSRGPVELLYA